MPRGDGTGPLGHGPMTGWGMGYCVVKLPEDGGPPRGYAGSADTPAAAEGQAPSGVRPALTGVGELGEIRTMVDSLARQIEDIQARIGHLRRKEG